MSAESVNIIHIDNPGGQIVAAPQNQLRTCLVLINNSSFSSFYGPTETVSTTAGMFIIPAFSSLTLKGEDYGDLVTMEFSVYSTAGMCSIVAEINGSIECPLQSPVQQLLQCPAPVPCNC
jgi:hypothetical protein